MNDEKNLLEKFKNIDFSPESANREKNLEKLKLCIGGNDMEKKSKIKKPVVIAAILAAALVLSVGTIAAATRSSEVWELIGVMKTTVDKDGNELTSEFIYAGDIEDLVLEDGEEIVTYEKARFYDFDEAMSYLVAEDPLLPGYIPAGLNFMHAEFNVDPAKHPDHATAISFTYENDTDWIWIQTGYFWDDDWGEMPLSINFDEVNEIELTSARFGKLNGRIGSSKYEDDSLPAHNSVLLQKGIVTIWVQGNNDTYDYPLDELIKVAEALK